MAIIQAIESDTDEIITKLIFSHDRYLLSDGSQELLAALPAWCFECSAFVLVEDLRQPEEVAEAIRNEYEQHIARNVEVHPDLGRDMATRYLYNSRWRSALRSRNSPARCLECTGTDFVEIPSDQSWLSHPGKGRCKVRLESGYIHAELSTRGRLYSLEGIRMPPR